MYNKKIKKIFLLSEQVERTRPPCVQPARMVAYSLTGGFGGEDKCEHGDLPEREEWLSPGTAPHDALVRLVMDKRLLKTIVRFVNFR